MTTKGTIELERIGARWYRVHGSRGGAEMHDECRKRLGLPMVRRGESMRIMWKVEPAPKKAAKRKVKQ